MQAQVHCPGALDPSSAFLADPMQQSSHPFLRFLLGKSFVRLSLSLVLLAPAVAAQTVGGAFEVTHTLIGTVAGDQLGSANAGLGDIDGDGYDDYIVGVPYANPLSKPDAGSVFVYSGATNLVLWQIDGTASAERFGLSVAAAGDIDQDGTPDFMVGAPYASPGGRSLAGSTFVYSGASGQLLLRLNGTGDGDLFGWAIDGIGDANGDGVPDILVGSWSANPTGRAYIFSGVDGGLLHFFQGADRRHFFGWSASAAGDVDGDGLADIIVGSHGAEPGGRYLAGSAYVYSGATGSLIYQFDGLANSDNFGWSVSAAGDVNGDGFADVIVGAKNADPNMFGNAGSAYVYSGATGLLLHQFDGAAPGDGFGSTVSDAGDLDGDGFSDVLVAAIEADPNGRVSAGSVYLYSGLSGQFLQQFDGNASQDAFGTSLSAAGDVNADGFADALIGAPFADSLDFGTTNIVGLNPFLTPTSIAMSAATGGVADLSLDFPTAAANEEYKVLFSTTGEGPVFFGVDIPLSLDSMLTDTYAGLYPFAVSSGLQGVLDANGDATASFTVPALPSSFVGRSLWMAAIANLPAALPNHSSVAVQMEILP